MVAGGRAVVKAAPQGGPEAAHGTTAAFGRSSERIGHLHKAVKGCNRQPASGIMLPVRACGSRSARDDGRVCVALNGVHDSCCLLYTSDAADE